MQEIITQAETSAAMDLPASQSALRDQGLDGWLFYDHRHSDPLGYCIWDLENVCM